MTKIIIVVSFWPHHSHNQLLLTMTLFYPMISMQSEMNCCRMIRQDSQLWDDLHQGVLTTGKLNACLGFYEPQAAKRLGIGKGFVSHRGLLSVYHHLMHDVYVPSAQVM